MKSGKDLLHLSLMGLAALELAGSESAHAELQRLKGSVRIIVNVPADTPEDETLYLTGDLPETCDWRPDCIPLEKIGWRSYEAKLDLPLESRMEFKITRGSWENEASDGRGERPANFLFDGINGATEKVVTILSWIDGPSLGVTGEIRTHRRFKSPELGNSRDILVWLPPGYDSEREEGYPVIYMHDGENAFDPETSTMGVDWGIDETLTRMIERDEVPDAIVVAISSTKNRAEEYTWSRRGRDYARFLVERVKPFIDSHYRTNPHRDSTFTLGSSMGAVISVALTWMYPDVFSAAGAVSLPAFVENDELHRLVKEEGAPSSPVRIYLDHGTIGQDEAYGNSAASLHRQLCDQGLRDGEEALYRVFKYSDHSEEDWSRRVEIPLRFLLEE